MVACLGTGVGKKICETVTPTGPTFTPVKWNWPFLSVPTVCEFMPLSEHEPGSNAFDDNATCAPKTGLRSGSITPPVTAPAPLKRRIPKPVLPSLKMLAEPVATSVKPELAATARADIEPKPRLSKRTFPLVSVFFLLHPHSSKQLPSSRPTDAPPTRLPAESSTVYSAAPMPDEVITNPVTTWPEVVITTRAKPKRNPSLA